MLGKASRPYLSSHYAHHDPEAALHFHQIVYESHWIWQPPLPVMDHYHKSVAIFPLLVVDDINLQFLPQRTRCSAGTSLFDFYDDLLFSASSAESVG
jgi:hypothetical protein